MALIEGRGIVVELGTWIAERIGCDPKDVLGIDLHLHVDDIPTADVRLVAKCPGIAEAVSRYQLVRLDDAEEGAT